MKIVTGFRGENHITSNDDQGRNQGIFGTGSYVLPVRSKFAATLVSANELQIGDGEGVLQGVHFRTEPTSTDSVTIENGSQGMLRTDLVCVRYEKNAETAVESVSWVVYTGTPAASNPVTPSYTEGDILAGDTVAEMPMYKVNLNGITVQSVTAMFETLVSAEGLIELLGDTSIASIGDGTVTGALSSLNTDLVNKANFYNIENGTNLNDLLSNGMYCSPLTIANVATLINCPVGAPFTMFVTGSGSVFTGTVQTILTDSNIFIRRGTSSGFGSWVKYQGSVT